MYRFTKKICVYSGIQLEYIGFGTFEIQTGLEGCLQAYKGLLRRSVSTLVYNWNNTYNSHTYNYIKVHQEDWCHVSIYQKNSGAEESIRQIILGILHLNSCTYFQCFQIFVFFKQNFLLIKTTKNFKISYSFMN